MSAKHGGKRPGAGKKAGAGGKMRPIGFRADRASRLQIEALARAKCQTVSEWLRDAALAHVARQLTGVM